MYIQFKELEEILSKWKTLSELKSLGITQKNDIKDKMLAQIMILFNTIISQQIKISQEINPGRTTFKMKYTNIISVIPFSKL